MKSNFSYAVSALLFLCSCASSPASKNAAQAQPSAAAQTAAADTQTNSANSVSIDASQSIQFPMTAPEKKKLTADFKKALANESAALDRKEKAELKSLTNDENARKKAWTAQEKKDRHAYFAQHMSGAERREYIQQYLKRKEAFEKSIKDEMNTAKHSWKEKHDYLSKFQKEREAQFKASMDQNKRPDSSLWPKE